jgi:hypothetical protein
MKREARYFSALLPVLLALCVLLGACGKGGKGVRINEVMASNHKSYTDDDGGHPDWIELYNGSGSAVDLTGWSITDDSADAEKYVFSGGEIPAHGFVLLYADKGSAKTGSAENARLNFGLSAKNGETLFLYDNGGKLVSKLEFPALGTDESYGVSSGKTGLLHMPTPGEPNSVLKDDAGKETPAGPGEAVACDVVINEYSTNDTQTLTDKNGDFTA